MRKLFLMVTVFLMGCGILSPEDPYLRVKVMEPEGMGVIFVAEASPKDTIFWRMEWDTGTMEGFAPDTDIVLQRPMNPDGTFATDRAIKWVAWSGNLSDSIMWWPHP